MAMVWPLLVHHAAVARGRRGAAVHAPRRARRRLPCSAPRPSPPRRRSPCTAPRPWPPRRRRPCSEPRPWPPRRRSPCTAPPSLVAATAPSSMLRAAPVKKRALTVALSVAGVSTAVLAAVGTAFYLVVFRNWDREAHVTVRLGESSSRRLCRDMEAVVMPTPEPWPLRPARALGCEEFTIKELSRLTNGFAEEAKIGSGSFGSVYRAKLPDGREVAIKRTERGSGGRRRWRFDAERAFRAELRLLKRVNHCNLVQRLGFCKERGERILVFEFMLRKVQLAGELGLDAKQVAVWFQNRRARHKSKLMEEFSKLRAAHDAVVLQNVQLESELLKLKDRLAEAEEERNLMEAAAAATGGAGSSSLSS
ncbi:hypothetical protein ACP4OV_024489 [Aristida adscensionis]